MGCVGQGQKTGPDLRPPAVMGTLGVSMPVSGCIVPHRMWTLWWTLVTGVRLVVFKHKAGVAICSTLEEEDVSCGV